MDVQGSELPAILSNRSTDPAIRSTFLGLLYHSAKAQGPSRTCNESKEEEETFLRHLSARVDRKPSAFKGRKRARVAIPASLSAPTGRGRADSKLLDISELLDTKTPHAPTFPELTSLSEKGIHCKARR